MITITTFAVLKQSFSILIKFINENQQFYLKFDKFIYLFVSLYLFLKSLS